MALESRWPIQHVLMANIAYAWAVMRSKANWNLHKKTLKLDFFHQFFLKFFTSNLFSILSHDFLDQQPYPSIFSISVIHSLIIPSNPSYFLYNSTQWLLKVSPVLTHWYNQVLSPHHVALISLCVNSNSVLAFLKCSRSPPWDLCTCHPSSWIALSTDIPMAHKLVICHPTTQQLRTTNIYCLTLCLRVKYLGVTQNLGEGGSVSRSLMRLQSSCWPDL